MNTEVNVREMTSGKSTWQTRRYRYVMWPLRYVTYIERRRQPTRRTCQTHTADDPTRCPASAAGRTDTYTNSNSNNKKAQLSLKNTRDAKACQKLLQFDMLTTLSLTILAYLHSFSCCCVRNLRNPAKFTENSNSWSSRSSKVIDLGVNRKPTYDFLLVTNSNFGRICYRFRDIDA